METYGIRLVFISVFLLFHVQSVAAFNAIQETEIGPQISGVRPTYLAMNKDYRSQKPPCSPLTVHMEHAQDLEETYASESTTPAKPSLLTPDVTSLGLFLNDEIRTSLWYLIADVANTWPLEPTASTMIEAMTTIKSARERERERDVKTGLLITSVSVKGGLKMLVDDVHNRSDWWCSLFETGGGEKARCTYDWYGLPDKAKAPFDACIFAAAACRPQPDHVLRAKEEHQHNLLQITIQTQSRGCSYSAQKQITYKLRGCTCR